MFGPSTRHLGTRAVDICHRRCLQSGTSSLLGFIRSRFRRSEGVAMFTVVIRVFGVVILCGGLAATMPSLADDRSADAILKEIDTLRLPQPDLSRENDKAYIRQFMRQRSKIRVRRADLIGELYRIDPDN